MCTDDLNFAFAKGTGNDEVRWRNTDVKLSMLRLLLPSCPLRTNGGSAFTEALYYAVLTPL